MNKKKEIDKLARLTVLANFVNSKLKEQKTLVKSFVTEEDKVLKGVEHKLNVIIRRIEEEVTIRNVKAARSNLRSFNVFAHDGTKQKTFTTL